MTRIGVIARLKAMDRKGYLPHSLVKAVVFWTLALCILTVTAAGILRAWNVLGDEWAGRCATSAVILACGSIAFLFVNCLFGELGSGLFSQSVTPHPMDPAFGERLKKAKIASDEEKASRAG